MERTNTFNPIKKLASVAFLAGAVNVAYAAQDKHVHGEAELYIAMQGQELLIELESPAANIIGFEHEPHTKAQKETLHKAMKSLSSYQSIVTLTNGGCQQVSNNVENPFSKHEDHHKEHKHHHDDHKKDKHAGHHHGSHHKDHHDKHDKHDEETHADFHVSYRLTCSHIADIKQADITAFKGFPGIEKLSVNWVSSSGQGGMTATRHKTQVKF